MEMGFRWDFAYEILPQMLLATLNTIIAAGVGYAIALVVGLFFLLGQRTPYKIINVVNREIYAIKKAMGFGEGTKFSCWKMGTLSLQRFPKTQKGSSFYMMPKREKPELADFN